MTVVSLEAIIRQTFEGPNPQTMSATLGQKLKKKMEQMPCAEVTAKVRAIPPLVTKSKKVGRRVRPLAVVKFPNDFK